MKTTFLKLSLLNIIIISLILSCKGKTDYIAKADWIYINKINDRIDVKEYGKTNSDFDFTIEPDGIYKIQTETSSVTNNFQTSDFATPFYNGAVVITNGIRDTIPYESKVGIVNPSNYVVKKIHSNLYEFTYTFTDDNLPSAEE